MRHAVIDIGSNSVRLVVFEVPESFDNDKGSIRIVPIWNKKNVAGLAGYIENGALSKAGIKRAIEAISRLLASARPLCADTTSAFATAVLRNISNSREACEVIASATGLDIDLLSGKDEARLGYIGCSDALEGETGIVVDMGGGSTEVTVQERPPAGKKSQKAPRTESVSFPFGSLSLYLDFVSDVLPTKGERYAIASFVRDRVRESGLLRPVSDAHDASFGKAVCLGGTARSALKLAKGITRIGEGDGSIAAGELDELLARSDSDYKDTLHTILRTCPERVHTVLAGTTALAEIMRLAGVRELMVSKRGIREGYLLERVLHRA